MLNQAFQDFILLINLFKGLVNYLFVNFANIKNNMCVSYKNRARRVYRATVFQITLNYLSRFKEL